MFGQRDYRKKYDAKNPKCAAIFHPMVDALASRVGGKSSDSFFKYPELRNQLDNDFQSGRRAIKLRGHEAACENITMQIALGTQSLEQEVFAIDPVLYGMVVTLPPMRSVIFGHAPGFADALGADPYKITLRSCFMISRVLEGCKQTDIVVGSRSLWSSFYEACLKFHGHPPAG